MRRVGVGVVGLLLVLGVGHVEGQTGLAGLKAGAAMSSVSDADDVSGQWGFSGGVYAAVGETVMGEFNALFTDRRVKVTDGTDELVISEKLIDLPILLVFRPGTGDVRARFYIGPQISVKTGCNLSIGSSSIDCTTAALTANSTFWSVLGGIGVDFAAGGIVLQLDGRYALGLTDVLGAAPSDFETDSKWRTFQLFAGIGIPVGR